MPGQLVYLSILKVLKDHFDKDPNEPVSSGELRAELNAPIEDIMPYVNRLVRNGYVFMARGREKGSGFLLKIRQKGLKALAGRRIDITA